MLALILQLFLTCASAEVWQLTNASVDFADPSPPTVLSTGQVRVTTTNGFMLTWKNTQSFLRADKAQVETIRAFHPDGRPFDHEGDEDLWDPTIQGDVMYAGVMTASTPARWPDDNWSRRTFAFRRVNGKWIRSSRPLWGEIPSSPTWVGHNYGHSIFQGHVFYERVTQDLNGLPWKTEIFARKMLDAFTTSDEISILEIPFSPWRNSLRSFGGSLIEGPRVFAAKGEFFISFSAGDYQSKDYGIHLARGKTLLGPYTPVLSRSGLSLKDFGAELERQVPMRWGAARAAYFELHGKWWALFHGIPENDPEAIERGYRSIWLAPVTFGADNLPRF